MNKPTELLLGDFQIIPAFDEAEKKVLANELDRLYAFQDRQLTTSNKAMLVQAITEAQLPLDALIRGIREMMTVELERIKLPMILAKAREHGQAKQEQDVEIDCHDCLRGHVFMRDDEKRQFVLACRCQRGVGLARTGLARWNGDGMQYNRGRRLTLDASAGGEAKAQ